MTCLLTARIKIYRKFAKANGNKATDFDHDQPFYRDTNFVYPFSKKRPAQVLDNGANPHVVDFNLADLHDGNASSLINTT